MSKIALTGAVALALVAGPALADGWLEGVARQAAGRAILNGVDSATDGERKKSGRSKRDETATAEAAPAPAAASDPNVSSEDPFAEPGVTAPKAYAGAPAGGGATGPAPWPINAGQRLSSPGQLKFDPALEAAKTEFREFSRYSCNDCEGGHGYDAWARHHIGTGGGYAAFEGVLGGLGLGQSVTWKGKESDGRITVVGETPVAGFQCKQLKWEMKKRKTGATAARDGLVCKAADSRYWVEAI